ncbi:hypothetical protein NLG97_g5072 [Lecanicillium saksenae]|uniref:Uncharacterized protein n=1 Tax=Lecanicillium saksenae TaxID=468837 RepID=A0ACC1QVD3_9HYPO|nr:hypothetical protein NLG97_g5072 [Lecanicillium saksenae]
MFTVMSHKETLVWCCPMGYSMDNDDRGSFCHSRVPTQTQYFYTTVGIATDCKPTTVTLEKKDYAPSASAKVLRLVVPTNGTFDPPLKNPGPSSLPRILLISILTPVGAIGLGILILFTRRARKRKRSRLGSQRAVTSSTRPNVEEKPKAEINQSGRTELSGGPVPLRSELASDPNSRHELNANSQVSELPGHAAVELEANNIGRPVY